MTKQEAIKDLKRRIRERKEMPGYSAYVIMELEGELCQLEMS